jgi:YVTN family beta-propeller protein
VKFSGFAVASLFSVIGIASAISAASADIRQPVAQDGSYSVLSTSKVGEDGGFDYVNCDPKERKLYVARRGKTPHVAVYDLDSLQHVGEIPNTGAHGAVIDEKYGHGFCSSGPVTMFDTKTLAIIKTIDVQGSPDGMLSDPFNHRIYVLSHGAPNITVIDAKDGAVLGTIDLGGAPEQAATDGAGHIYVDIEDKASVAIIDAKAMKVSNNFDLAGKGAGNAGLALDAKNHVLFVACRNPQVMVMLDAKDGKFLASLPIGRGCDGVVFDPSAHRAFSSQGDGTLTVIKESSPTSFIVDQTVQTMPGAKTCTLDPKTGKILLIAAEYGPAPEGAATSGRPRRGPMLSGSFSIIAVGK